MDDEILTPSGVLEGWTEETSERHILETVILVVLGSRRVVPTPYAMRTIVAALRTDRLWRRFYASKRAKQIRGVPFLMGTWIGFRVALMRRVWG